MSQFNFASAGAQINENGIIAALEELTEAVQPINVYVDLPVNLPVSGWSNTTPSTYTWSSESVTPECGIEVHFANGSENILTPYIYYEKASGSVVFSAPAKPAADIPVVIRILNAAAESFTSVTDEMVSTSTTQGASNVKQALTMINSDISTINSNLNIKIGQTNPYLITDCDNGTPSNNQMYSITNIDTLHTPYKQGLTTAGNQIIWTLYGNGTYNTQIAVNIGANNIYIRRRNSGGWSTWEELVLNGNITPSAITATRDTTNTSSGSINAYKSAGLIIVDIDVTVGSASSVWMKIGTISPAPSHLIYGNISDASGNTRVISVNTSGEIKILGPNATEYMGSIVIC